MEPVRFISKVSDQFICPICLLVVYDPLQDSEEHMFCRKCIVEWLAEHQNCPVDRDDLTIEDLKPITRVVRNLLNELQLTCDFKDAGCEKIIKYEDLEKHKKECNFDEKNWVTCPKGCEIRMQREKLIDHSCIAELKKECKRLENLIEQSNEKFKSEIKRLQDQINLNYNNSNNNPTMSRSINQKKEKKDSKPKAKKAKIDDDDDESSNQSSDDDDDSDISSDGDEIGNDESSEEEEPVARKTRSAKKRVSRY